MASQSRLKVFNASGFSNCQTLALLVSSKVHLLKALEMIRKVAGYYTLEKALDDITGKISTGMPLSEAMESHKFFDRKMIAMTKVGEEVNLPFFIKSDCLCMP